jgi:hypothetical protein
MLKDLFTALESHFLSICIILPMFLVRTFCSFIPFVFTKYLIRDVLSINHVYL